MLKCTNPFQQIQSHFRHSQSHLCHCPRTAVSALWSARLNTRKLYKNVFTLSMDKPFYLLFPARTSFSLREEGMDGKPGQLSRGVVYKWVSKRTLASGKRHKHLKWWLCHWRIRRGTCVWIKYTSYQWCWQGWRLLLMLTAIKVMCTWQDIKRKGIPLKQNWT